MATGQATSAIAMSKKLGGACTRWKVPPLHGAHPSATLMRGDFIVTQLTVGKLPHRPTTRRASAVHDVVNGLRIVNCRSITWPSCMSSE